MPYSVPDLSAAARDASGMRNHHRSSAGHVGAFAPISNLPRRKQARASPPVSMFQFHTDSDTSDDDDHHRRPLSLDTTFTPPGIPFPVSEEIPPRSPSALAPKPLRSSLKSSQSTPQLPLHLRSQSAPSSPHTPTPKNVHFKDDSRIASVKVFHTAGKPANISRGREQDETETETDDALPTTLSLAPPPVSSPIPAPPPVLHPSLSYPHILLLSLTLSPAQTDDSPPQLAGSVLVRNIAYEKHVAVRFTLDDWRTTSEVAASYSGPGILPPQWPSNDHPYDTFTFRIALHALHRPHPRVLFLAARLNAAGGEWWDNNASNNYKVAFRIGPYQQPKPNRPPMPPRSLSSPATYRPRPAPPQPARDPLPSSIPFPTTTTPADTTLPPLSNINISLGTGFSSFSLPPTSTPPPSSLSSSHSTRLTLKNYAPPVNAKPDPSAEKASPLPTPPVSRSSSSLDIHPPQGLVGGHRATVDVSPTPPPHIQQQPKEEPSPSRPASSDTYATLLARWCFATDATPRAMMGGGEEGKRGTMETGTGWKTEVGWV